MMVARGVSGHPSISLIHHWIHTEIHERMAKEIKLLGPALVNTPVSLIMCRPEFMSVQINGIIRFVGFVLNGQEIMLG